MKDRDRKKESEGDKEKDEILPSMK